MLHLCITEIVSVVFNESQFLIDFSRNQMYNNYRKSSSECELKYYENYA